MGIKINELYSKLKFLNGQFTKLKIQYWIQIISDQEQIKEFYSKMVTDLKKELEKVLKEPSKLK
jgi:hypothetical protein